LLSFCLFFAGPFIPFKRPLVKVKRATREKAAVYWWHSDYGRPDWDRPAYWLIMLTKPSDVTAVGKACFFFVKGRITHLYLPLILTVGSEYRVSVAAMSHVFIDKSMPSFLVFDAGSMNFRAGTSRSYQDWSYILCRSFYNNIITLRIDKGLLDNYKW